MTRTPVIDRGRPPRRSLVAEGDPPRVMVLWCPDWPVTAAVRAAGLAEDVAVALIDKGLVFASSASARAQGVSRGLRVREAQARYPELTVLDYDPALDARSFEPVLAGIEQLIPGVQPLRPGMCAVRLRGASRYYGGEQAAALALAGTADDLGAHGARVGVADGIFTAEHAARATRGSADTAHVVPVGDAAGFLSPLGIELVEDERLITLLRRLGIRTLGDFAALPAPDVATRFGPEGARLHALAGGHDTWPLVGRTPPPDHEVSLDFEPAVEVVDQIAFGVRSVADGFIQSLAGAKLVCTAIRVVLHSDAAEFSERVWLHPRSFSPADVVDRVRWQLAAAFEARQLSAGVIRVQIAPEAVDAIGHHEAGLWGAGPDERIHHALTRVQSLLGHGAVVTPVVSGGRSLAERQQWVPWGDPVTPVRSPAPPWPGQLPPPLPGTVFSPRHAVQVLSADGAVVSVDARGLPSAPPAAVTAGARVLTITAWAGPWPLTERWWAGGTTVWRYQLVDDTGCGWLMVLDASGWWAEARYD